jgi:hypothetical protein
MPAPAMVALMRNPCHQDRDNFGIAHFDIRGSTEAGKLFAAVRFTVFRLASLYLSVAPATLNCSGEICNVDLRMKP